VGAWPPGQANKLQINGLDIISKDTNKFLFNNIRHLQGNKELIYKLPEAVQEEYFILQEKYEAVG
jgi:hypothetical protein